MFSCRQNAFLLSPDSRQERTTRSICSSVCFMITVFHKAKHKLPSCKDVLARVLTIHCDRIIGHSSNALSGKDSQNISNHAGVSLPEFLKGDPGVKLQE